MGDIYGAEDSRLNLRKEQKKVGSYEVFFSFLLVYVLVLFCLAKIGGRHEENSTTRWVLR